MSLNLKKIILSVFLKFPIQTKSKIIFLFHINYLKFQWYLNIYIYYYFSQLNLRRRLSDIVSSVNILQKAIYRKSLKWQRFHCEIMSLRGFERKLPRKTNCKCTLYRIFMHQKLLVIFLERNCSLHIKMYERNQK